MKLTKEQKIAYALRQMGVHQDLKGYRYLRVAIGAVVDHPELIDNITKKLYPYVANECGTTPLRVERAIRHAIETSWYEIPYDALQDVFGYSVPVSKDKPTNSHYIAAVAEVISEYVEHIILPKDGDE